MRLARADRRPVPLLLLVLLLVPGLPACEEEAASEADAVSILERMLRAEENVSYRARKRLVSPRSDEADEGASGRGPGARDWEHLVTHYAGGPTVFTFVKPDGESRSRVMDRGRFYWLGDLDVLLANYRVREAGRGRIEGRDVDTIVVESVHEGRPSMSFTVDRATGLLLRAESRDWRGEVTMRSEITDLEIDPELPPAPEADPDRFRGALLSPGEEADPGFVPLEPGWLPKGFVEKGRSLHRGRRERLKTVYADGLGWIELSQGPAEPGSGEEELAKRWTRGSRTSLKVVLDGVEVRLVGRLPPEILLRVLDSLKAPGGN